MLPPSRPANTPAHACMPPGFGAGPLATFGAGPLAAGVPMDPELLQLFRAPSAGAGTRPGAAGAGAAARGGSGKLQRAPSSPEVNNSTGVAVGVPVRLCRMTAVSSNACAQRAVTWPHSHSLPVHACMQQATRPLGLAVTCSGARWTCAPCVACPARTTCSSSSSWVTTTCC